jgi:hypothetical protein
MSLQWSKLYIKHKIWRVWGVWHLKRHWNEILNVPQEDIHRSNISPEHYYYYKHTPSVPQIKAHLEFKWKKYCSYEITFLPLKSVAIIPCRTMVDSAGGAAAARTGERASKRVVQSIPRNWADIWSVGLQRLSCQLAPIMILYLWDKFWIVDVLLFVGRRE